MSHEITTTLGELAWHAMSPWQRELAELYWYSDISVKEIMAAYELPHIHRLIEIVGPKVLAGVRCRVCAGKVTVFSRTELKDRLADLEYDKTNRRTYYRPVWTAPDVCIDCRTELGARASDQFTAAEEARRQREQFLRTMPYREYLQTPEWQETRKAALKRAGFRCQTCCSDGQLNVHHRTYARRGAEWAKDLIVLCAGCHQLFHESSKLAEAGRADA